MKIAMAVMLSAACAVGAAAANDVRTLDHVAQQGVKVGGEAGLARVGAVREEGACGGCERE